MYKPSPEACALMALAVEMRLRHPAAPAREILDEVMRAHRGAKPAFGAVLPTTPFGQLVAEAFDGGMEPSDWIGLLNVPDPSLHVALHDIWEAEVWPRFLAAYREPVSPPRTTT